MKKVASMKELASQFGKEIGEPFEVEIVSTWEHSMCRFTERRFEVYNEDYDEWERDKYGFLEGLLTKKVVILDEA